MKWKFIYYNNRVEKEVLGLPKELLAEFLGMQDMMEIKGPHLGMPYTRAMGDSLFEMRISGKDNIVRIFYGTVTAGEIIILNSFIKKTQKTPDHELKLARKRLKEVQHHG